MIPIDRSSTVPVYRQIYNHFRAGILDGTIPSNEPLPSIRQLQNELGLARESIKRAMTELAEDVFLKPARIGWPQYDGSLADVVKNPRFATAMGLLVEADSQRRRGRKRWPRGWASRSSSSTPTWVRRPR